MSMINTNISTSKCDYRVAIIDSDIDLNNHITNALSAFGCTVFQAFSSEEISHVIAKNPDFIIIDPIHNACNEAMLREYLTNPEAAGVIVFASDISLKRREYLFESGILELFSKEEPLDTIADEFVHIFGTIKNNQSHYVTMIGSTDLSQKRFNQLVMHRNYQLSLLDTCSKLIDKWNDHTHELPDLLVLDCTSGQHLNEGFSLIHFIRTIKLSKIPIILLLNESDAHASSKLYRVGVNEVLIEPYKYEKLLSKITHHLDYQISKKWLHHEQSLSNQLPVHH